MSTFTFSLGDVKSVEAGLSSKTPDDKLTYSGNDPIIWDRINNQRLSRGLDPLPTPRPTDDGKTYPAGRGSATNNTNASTGKPLTAEEKAKAAEIAKKFGLPDPTATSKTFDVDGPPGMTRDEAYAIFQKQASSGGLTGFSPGDVLSAKTQAADGLPAAQAMLAQSNAGFPGTSTGALNSFTNVVDTAKQSLAAGITGIAGVGSILQKTVAKIGSLFGSPVTNGISTADFATTAPALLPMAGLSTTDVRATMAAVGTGTGQGFTDVNNSVGCGKYGFDATQLESAGLLKPGTASTYLNQGANDLTSVLKSPAVWTGKGGINNLDGFLSNPASQNLTQQSLMSSGLASAAAIGVPISSLNTKELAGVSANFAKGSAGGVDWVKGNLPPDKQADFDTRFKEAQFAVGSADSKLNDAVLQQAPPGEATDTVNRETLTAALGRVFGNDKIPPIDYNGPTPPPSALFAENKRLVKLTNQQQIKLADLDNKLQEVTAKTAGALIALYNAILKSLNTVAKDYVSLQKDIAGKPYTEFIATVDSGLAIVLALIDDISTLYLVNLRRAGGR